MIVIFTIMKSIPEKPSYHHGDLRQTLIEAATNMIRESGIEGLSLRKLAECVGVSRTAPYHHFKNKNELLCAIATEGFRQRHLLTIKSFADDSTSLQQRFKSFVHNYVKFSEDNPELYELMFGRSIWKNNKSTQELRDTAYPCFHHQLEMTKLWQEAGLINPHENTLRISQVIWGTLHGITKLLIDGIYTDSSYVSEICECAVNLFVQPNSE